MHELTSSGIYSDEPRSQQRLFSVPLAVRLEVQRGVAWAAKYRRGTAAVDKPTVVALTRSESRTMTMTMKNLHATRTLS